jgi:tetratricopeptide (TPR) repeat protein
MAGRAGCKECLFMNKRSQRTGAQKKRPAASPPVNRILKERERLEQAQALVYRAWEATTDREAAALAHEALERFPDCADAYRVLAESEARSANEARLFYQQAVDAGRRQLGEAVFDQQAGHFWGLIETRPYMRARQGLADCLWALGRKEDSIAHCEALLALNPDDNQGIRYGLLNRYLALGDDAAAERLFHRYAQDSSAAFLWSRVLLDLRRGDRVAAQEDLRTAMQGNPHVADLLTGKRTPPARLPEQFSPGDRHEAALYFAGFAEAWLASTDAREWLLDQLTK